MEKDDLNRKRGHAIIGFNHGLPCYVKNMALGPQSRQKPRPTASVFVYLSPLGHVFNIAWQSMIKTYNQAWLNAINKNYDSSKPNKLKTYANFKKSFGMENYLLCMKTKNKRRHFTKLRISAHHLPIEKGRYSRPVTPRDQRFCQSCDMMSIGDEFHFLLVCPKHDEQRLILFDQLSKFTILSNEQDQDTFIHLMSCCHGDTEVSNLVCRFVENCLTDV